MGFASINRAFHPLCIHVTFYGSDSLVPGLSRSKSPKLQPVAARVEEMSGEKRSEFDVAVIGAGMGAYHAVEEAAKKKDIKAV